MKGLPRAVIFDRDGIFVKKINNEAPTKVSELELIPEIIPLVKKIKKLGFLTIITSNQPDTALGKINEITKATLKNKFVKLLKKNKITVDAVYYCHHHAQGIIPKYIKVCDCRKPKPGMIIKGIKQFRIDPKNSFMLGDRASDVKAGETSGIKTILFDPYNSQKNYLIENNVKPDYTIKRLAEILTIIDLPKKQAFILAAGLGSRMGKLTKHTPKPLLKINGEPIMEYTIRLCAKYDVQEIGVNLFYLGSQVKKYFGDGKKWGVKILYVKEKELSGTAGAVKNIAKLVKPQNAFFCISPDILTNFDLTDIYNFHLTHHGLATLCCYFRTKKQLVVGKSGLVVFDKKSHQIKKFIERPQTENEIISQWVYSSICVLDPAVINIIPNGIKGNKIVDLPRDIFPHLLKLRKKIYAYPVNRKKYYQLGIDTPDRLKIAENDIKKGMYGTI